MGVQIDCCVHVAVGLPWPALGCDIGLMMMSVSIITSWNPSALSIVAQELVSTLVAPSLCLWHQVLTHTSPGALVLLLKATAMDFR